MGEVAALLTALCWAVAARMFRILGSHFSALSLNLWKGVVAIIGLVIFSWLDPAPLSLTQNQIFWLLLSGIIGIGIGDTFFFAALRRIGDSQSVLIAETFAPVFTALLAMAWISEWLTWQQWLGAAVVLFSVDMIVKQNKRSQYEQVQPSGYWFAGGAAVCQSVGAVISRDILTAGEATPADASLIRLVGGLMIVMLLLVWRKKPWLPVTTNPSQAWSLLVAASFVGTLAAMYLQMLSFAHTPAAVVQTLFATSVLLSLLVARVMGESIPKRALLWSGVAVAGVMILLGQDFFIKVQAMF
ncbi:DMT family transporter [Paraneptunicella aestuarii]|uniref:DMT family transporter n=1 Tax=Paraneptunicella aestuarii TaxID=2831148 RepID=UPI001E595062|nr:DMT family transporter [Paraneptunicella aestuarii]UAA40848.1 DMT family transporter [Paraneptunicella aestuarii]